MYSITLADGSILRNLELDGNNYISPEELTADDFDGKLSSVTIDDGEGYSETIADCVLYRCIPERGGKTRLIIGEKTEKMKQEDRNTELELALTELYEMIIGG